MMRACLRFMLRSWPRVVAYLVDMTRTVGRSVCRTYIEDCIARNRPFIALFIDLNDFKSVNDTHGHAVGDWLLLQIAARVRIGTRRKDLAVRIGGDEFVVVLRGQLNAVEAKEKVTQLIDSVAKQYGASAAVGAARYPADGKSFDVLLEVADRAMYKDKRVKKGERRRG